MGCLLCAPLAARPFNINLFCPWAGQGSIPENSLSLRDLELGSHRVRSSSPGDAGSTGFSWLLGASKAGDGTDARKQTGRQSATAGSVPRSLTSLFPGGAAAVTSPRASATNSLWPCALPGPPPRATELLRRESTVPQASDVPSHANAPGDAVRWPFEVPPQAPNRLQPVPLAAPGWQYCARGGCRPAAWGGRGSQHAQR